MCYDNRPSGMKLVFLKSVKEINDFQEKATPARIAKEYNMTYRHILNIAYELSERKLIKRVMEDWKIRYELTENGKRILYT